MSNVHIVEGDVLERLIFKIEDLERTVVSIEKERATLAKPLMTVKEVCEYLGKGSTWLDANKGEIGFTKAGGEIRFKRKDVEEYLEQSYFKRGITNLRPLKQKSR